MCQDRTLHQNNIYNILFWLNKIIYHFGESWIMYYMNKSKTCKDYSLENKNNPNHL